MKTLHFIILLTFLFLSGKTFSQTSDTKQLTTDSLIGKSTPEFSGTSLTGIDWDNEKLKGKVVLLNFWYIGCPPCMKEIKYFNSLQEKYKSNDFVLLSIAPQVKEDLILFNDTVKSSVPATVRDYFKAEPINYEIIPACDVRKHDDPNKIGVECDNITKDFYVQGYPTTILIDNTGIIRHIQSGFADTDKGEQSMMEDYTEIIDQFLRK